MIVGMIACIVVLLLAILVGTFITVVANASVRSFKEDEFVHFIEQSVNGMDGTNENEC
jgi:hypothetical protein